MNLFSKYGIKEVADVVFYSITRVGDEEFYTPVLFLDTLKVSTIEKSAEKVSAKGGLGNKKLISWNFGKEITVSLEDALFSPASMSMIWGGKLNSNLSTYTSAIVKANIANKYGQLHYSTKAYPSPAFTDEEWEIIFQAATESNLQIPYKNEKIEFDPDLILRGTSLFKKTKVNNNIDSEEENGLEEDCTCTLYLKRITRQQRRILEQSKKENGRLWLGQPESGTINMESNPPIIPYFPDNYMEAEFFDLDNCYSAKAVIKDKLGNIFTFYYDLIYTANDYYYNEKREKVKYTGPKIGFPDYNSSELKLSFENFCPFTRNFWLWEKYDESKDMNYNPTESSVPGYNWLANQLGIAHESYSESEGIEYTILSGEYSLNNNNLLFRLNAIPYTNKEYLQTKDIPEIEENRNNLRKAYFQRLWAFSPYQECLQTLNNVSEQIETQSAMPQVVINKMISYIDNIKKIGEIETQIYDLEVIDRMERCIVTKREGLTISTSQQKENLLRYYQDDKSSSYIIYYDAKTMEPLLSLSDDGTIRGWDDNGIYDRDFDRKTDEDAFKLKIGTVYYKWSRTVKYKNGEDDGILGRTFVIDADTFPDTYKIVGETYVRNQKTGKDERMQFVIHRAQVSADTSITLQADGDPTTFSMSVEVLTPVNDVMIELKQFDVDEDNLHGGTRIVPQKSKYTYTPATFEMSDEIQPENNEIF